MKLLNLKEAVELLRLTPALFCTSTLDGRIRSLGPQWEALLGISVEDMIGTSFLRYVYPGDHAETVEAMSALSDGSALSDFVNRWIAPDGRVIYLAWSGSQRGDLIYSIAMDVTAARTRDLAAREDAAKLALVEEISGVAHWTLKLGETPRLHWSDQVFRIHGLEPGSASPSLEEAIACYHPDDRARVAASVARAIETGESFEFQLRILKSDGSERQVVAKGIVQTDQCGESVAIAGVFQDVTERMLMLKERQLINQERLESVSLLATGIAHEINNPLQYVMANMALATRALDTAESSGAPVPIVGIRGRLHDAEHGIAQVSSIVGDLRMFLAQDSREVVDVDLATALRTAFTMARGKLQRVAEFEHRVSELPSVRGDSGALVQVIVNLLINAGHAVAHLDRKSARVSLAGWTGADGSAVIEVEDNGKGIPEANLSRIFEPFFTTRTLGEGTGLGLHVSRRIVDSMGGRLDMWSAPGRTTFRVTLPPAHAHLAAIDTPPASLPTLLVIDDDPRVARVVAMMCAEEFEARVELDPWEALRVLKEEHFDVIICDIMMPEMDGWMLLLEAEAAQPGIRSRFVMMSGADVETSRPASLIGGPFLNKPFGYDEVIAALRASLQLVHDESSVGLAD
ncbi:MAG: PAS domain S-box-containing protein [Flavobacteriales bacterium]|jgi:PAS domain S-box-containing protein